MYNSNKFRVRVGSDRVRLGNNLGSVQIQLRVNLGCARDQLWAVRGKFGLVLVSGKIGTEDFAWAY